MTRVQCVNGRRAAVKPGDVEAKGDEEVTVQERPFYKRIASSKNMVAANRAGNEGEDEQLTRLIKAGVAAGAIRISHVYYPVCALAFLRCVIHRKHTFIDARVPKSQPNTSHVNPRNPGVKEALRLKGTSAVFSPRANGKAAGGGNGNGSGAPTGPPTEKDGLRIDTVSGYLD